MTTTDDLLFIGACRQAVRTMQEAGINETLIACVLTEVRSATLNAERFRVSEVHRTNPPTHHDFGHVLKLLHIHD